MEETQFRETYIEKINDFVSELVATQLTGTDRFKQILYLHSYFWWNNFSGVRESNRYVSFDDVRFMFIDQQFKRGVSPILSNARETTDEPI